jgi:hypothetical protein
VAVRGFLPHSWEDWRSSGIRIPLEPPPAALRVASASSRVAPALPVPAEHHLYPVRLIRARPGLRAREFFAELASIFWRTVHAQMRPCCLGHRYGHGWQHGWSEQVTHGGNWPTRTLYTQPDHLLIGYQEKRTRVGHGVLIDYVAIQQGPPAACPTCGCPPPRARMREWQQHLQRHSGSARGPR